VADAQTPQAASGEDIDSDQEALLEKLLGQDYEVVTADDRLDQLYLALPSPLFSDADQQAAAREVYQFVWQQAASGALQPA
jgi:hypothetical protein